MSLRLRPTFRVFLFDFFSVRNHHLVLYLLYAHLDARHDAIVVLLLERISRRQEWIQAYFESLVQERSYQSAKKRTGWCVQTRVCVYFNQIYGKVLIYHEVVAKKLKWVEMLTLWVFIMFCSFENLCLMFYPICFQSLRYRFLDFGINFSVKICILLFLQVMGKVLLWDFVSHFIFAVLFVSVLDSIVSEVDVSVL